MTDAPDNQAELSFEDAFKRLEAIVAELEQSQLPLEAALARFAEGTRLYKLCSAKLEKAEVTVKTLTETLTSETPSADTQSAAPPPAESGEDRLGL